MSGYTPLFSSLATGTLCGKWPDIGLWPIVLSLADRHGTVDVTPAYLASITGLPVDDVIACMKRFCEPDPYSRSTEHGGARLIMIDAGARDWGWIVVNHGKYREKARLQAKDSARTESGRDAARKAAERSASPGNGSCPPLSPAVPLSDNTKQDIYKTAASGRPAKVRKGRRPADFTLSPNLRGYVEQQLPQADADQFFTQFCDQADAKGWEYVDWAKAFQTYCRNAKPDSGHFAAGQYPKKSAQPLNPHAHLRMS